MFNLASKARPYFGAVVLTAGLLTAGGIYSATRMPSSVYPEVTFPRIAVVAKVPDLDVANMEVQVTRPLEEAVSTVLGVAAGALQDHPRRQRAVHRLRPRHRHAPGRAAHLEPHRRRPLASCRPTSS